MSIQTFRHKLASAAAGFALRHLGTKRPYVGEVEEAVRKDWKCDCCRLGLGRHSPWHDRFRQQWVKLRRGK